MLCVRPWCIDGIVEGGVAAVGPLRRAACGIGAVGLALICASQGLQGQSSALFAQTAQVGLSRVSLAGDSSRVRWLLLDARSGQRLAAQWPDAAEPIPVGSLTKPFVALAYARTHQAYPLWNGDDRAQAHCRSLTIERAIGYSCNGYFLSLAAATSRASMASVAQDFGLPAPPVGADPSAAIGLSGAWRIAPEQLAQAYLRLLTSPHTGVILGGMKVSASEGTAHVLRPYGVLAKTGTAPCLSQCIANGDGFVIVMSTAADPRLLLMVEAKGTTGAGAAAVAAKMMKELQMLHGDS